MGSYGYTLGDVCAMAVGCLIVGMFVGALWVDKWRGDPERRRLHRLERRMRRADRERFDTSVVPFDARKPW